MEFFDIFDAFNNPLNFAKERKQVHIDGEWHRTSQIWVINKSKDVLCNLRSDSKDLFAGYWDLSIGGHVIAGDNYENTAVRELNEELGITANCQELEFLCDEKIEGEDKEKKLIDREHARLFLFKSYLNLEHYKIQEEEIQKIEFIPLQKLISIIKGKDYSSYKFIPIKTHSLKVLQLIEGMRI